MEETTDEINQNMYPCIHLQSEEEGELFGEFFQTTKHMYFWETYVNTTSIRVKVINRRRKRRRGMLLCSQTPTAWPRSTGGYPQRRGIY